MSQYYKKFNLNFISRMTGGNRIATLVLLAGLGLFMLFWPNTAIEIVVRIAGAVLVVLGGQYLYSWFRGDRRGDMQPVIIGAVIALAGLFLLLSPGAIVSILNIAAGIALILYGIATLNTAMAVKQSNSNQWITTAVIAAATLILGVICLFSHTATSLIVRGVGIALIINAVTQFMATR